MVSMRAKKAAPGAVGKGAADGKGAAEGLAVAGAAALSKGLVCRNAIAIASGKGGVGKTWFAITLASVLAKQGKRVLLFDGDLGLANVDIQLGLSPDLDLGGVLAGSYGLQAATTPVAGAGFDVIAGRSGVGKLANLPTERLALLLGDLLRLARRYDHVILDLGAGIERTVRQLAALAGTCLVVTNDEPTALTDAYAFMKLLLTQMPETDCRVVINMASSSAEGLRTYATLQKACKTFLKNDPPLAGIIRRDTAVRDAIRSQKPIISRFPNATALENVRELALKLERG